MSANRTTSPWAGKSILVVDDYPAIRRAIKEIVASLDLVVTEAENGIEAQKILASKPFDIVLTDLVMPEMDGFELAEALRSTPQFRRLPIVVISTHDDTKYIIRALRLGVDDYLIKPPTLDMVKVVLGRIFDYE
ncbi:MAG: response regulator [Planctomycetota bacterium]|jgi:CheY-like chemotaxis protein|nr:response regulator [Planctomycetota bacterium]